MIDDDSSGPTVDVNCGATFAYISFFNQDDGASAAVTGFELQDLVADNGMVTSLSGSDDLNIPRTFAVDENLQGFFTLTVPFGAVVDAQGQPNSAGSCTYYVDERRPSVALTGPAGGGPVYGPFELRLTFDEPVTGLELSDLAVVNGAASELQGVEASRLGTSPFYAAYTVTITAAGSGEVTVDLPEGRVQDGGGNGNLAADRFSIVMEAPEVRLSLSLSELSEGSGATEVTVTATLEGGVLLADTEVTVTVSGSGASGVVGFAPVQPFVVSIPARHSSGAAVFTLTPQDDTTAAVDETVTVSGTAGAAGLPVAAAALTLSDDDEPSTELYWSLSPLEIPEGAGPTEVTVTVSLDAAARLVDTEVTGTVRLNRVADIVRGRSFTFTFTLPAGATTGTGAFTLTPVQDDDVETRGGGPGSANRLRVTLSATGLQGIPDPDAEQPLTLRVR